MLPKRGFDRLKRKPTRHAERLTLPIAPGRIGFRPAAHRVLSGEQG